MSTGNFGTGLGLGSGMRVPPMEVPDLMQQVVDSEIDRLIASQRAFNASLVAELNQVLDLLKGRNLSQLDAENKLANLKELLSDKLQFQLQPEMTVVHVYFHKGFFNAMTPRPERKVIYCKKEFPPLQVSLISVKEKTS